MAIEIKIPETETTLTHNDLVKELRHLIPVITAYIASFIFIGSIWYRHLKIFSLVKTYDNGLVFRNLMLLFFIGFFPFCASIISRSQGASVAFFIYSGIILLCITSQYLLHYYIINHKPLIRIEVDMSEQKLELRKKLILIISFALLVLFGSTAFYFITDPEIRSFIPLLALPIVVLYKILTRKKKNDTYQVY